MPAPKPTKPREEPHVPADAAIAELPAPPLPGAQLTAEEMAALARAYDTLDRRLRHVLTARLGLGVEPKPLREVARRLSIGVSYTHRLQTLALDRIAEAVAAGDANVPTRSAPPWPQSSSS